MKFTALIALIATASGIQLDAEWGNTTGAQQRCLYKVEGDVCTKLNDNVQPPNCIEAPATNANGEATYWFQHTASGRCTW